MDKEQTIKWAREAGMVIYEGDQDRVLFDVPITDALNRFAELVAAHEREACAQVCDKNAPNDFSGYDTACRQLAEAIRARST